MLKTAHRLAKLQELTAALAGARGVDSVGPIVAEVGREALGAVSALLWILDGEALVLRGHAGVPAEFIAPYRVLTAASPSAAFAVFQAQQPTWIETEEDYIRYDPAVAHHAKVAGRILAFAAIPLVVEGGAVGLVAFSYPAPHAFDEDERAYIQTIAQQCAQSLHTVQLIEAERAARTRLVALQQVTAALANVQTHEDVFTIVERDIAPVFSALISRLFVLGDDRRLHRSTPPGFVAAPGEELTSMSVDDPLQTARCWRERTLLEFDVVADAAREPRSAQLATAVGVQASAVVPLLRGDGDPLGVIGIGFADRVRLSAPDRELLWSIAHQCADAIDRVRLRAQEAFARELAEESNRAKDEFLAILGHELRNPLAPIVSALELMAIDPARTARARTVIERQVQHLRRLVDDLLDVSRLTRGTVELRKEIIDVAASVRDAVSAMRPLISERGHDVVVELPSDLRVNGDPARLAQIFTNLLANAARYTPRKGAISVTASLDGDHVIVRISDDGPGIPAELKPRLFAMFAQGERSLDRAEGGLGLGLAIVKALVEQHGGEVAVFDREPRGTVAEVRLPAAKGAYVEVRSPSPAASLSTGLRVLVVDDNVDAATFLGELLQLNGCVVQIAHDGHAALEAAPGMTPDLAVLDLGLPVIDGYELAERLRAHPSLAQMSIVALSGYAQDHDIERSQRAGFLEHLSKPLDAPTLQRLLERLSRARQSSS